MKRTVRDEATEVAVMLIAASVVLAVVAPAHASSWEWHFHTGFPTAPIGTGLSWLWHRLSEGAGYPMWWIGDGYRW